MILWYVWDVHMFTCKVVCLTSGGEQSRVLHLGNKLLLRGPQERQINARDAVAGMSCSTKGTVGAHFCDLQI